jgi:hypothetical protein
VLSVSRGQQRDRMVAKFQRAVLQPEHKAPMINNKPKIKINRKEIGTMANNMTQEELDLWSDINNPNNDCDMDDWADAHNPNE